VLRVVGGKGLKDREIPISDEVLARLRAFWKQHRNPEWMFPAPGRGWMTTGSTLAEALHRSDEHLSDSAVQPPLQQSTVVNRISQHKSYWKARIGTMGLRGGL
jgi:integrase